jgi:hypothetical protein
MKVEVFMLVQNCSCVGFDSMNFFCWLLAYHQKLLLLCLTVLKVGARSSCKLSVMAVQCHKPQDHILAQEIGVVCEYR